MSKLANQSIKYDSSISVSVKEGVLEIKKGDKTALVHLNGVTVDVSKEDSSCKFSLSKEGKSCSKANLGTCVALFKSAIAQFGQPYGLTLVTQGVGFKAMVLPGNLLLMWLGRSHLYCVRFADGINVVAKDNKISISGDKVAVTMLASVIKTNRPWDPCMKKGVIIEGEFLVRKEGKKKK